jgi:RimJ/RimL family protein N-acetyltransferase
MIAIEPLVVDDYARVAEWLSKPDVNEWLSSEWRHRVIDPSLVAIAVRNKRNRFYLVRSNGIPCGFVALSDLDPVDRIAMVWYALGDPSSGGKGVTSAAVRALAEMAFGPLELEALNAWVIDGNDASRRVLTKNGFCESGRLRASAVSKGQRVDRVYFDLTRHDFLHRADALP